MNGWMAFSEHNAPAEEVDGLVDSQLAVQCNVLRHVSNQLAGHLMPCININIGHSNNRAIVLVLKRVRGRVPWVRGGLPSTVRWP